MKDVALFYGTYTGVTGTVAQKIVNELGADKVDLYNICKDGDKMDIRQTTSKFRRKRFILRSMTRKVIFDSRTN